MIFVYRDYGVARNSLLHSVRMANMFGQVSCLDAADIIKGSWTNEAKLFIMPGGFDLGYLAKLGNIGNDIIKRYVKNGGAYLGICAGSYYGCKDIFFSSGGQEITGERLGLLDYKGIGPLFPYDYKSYAGARILKIAGASMVYNGGPHFMRTGKSAEVIETWNEKDLIISGQFGTGKVILSSIHIELEPWCNKIADDKFLKKLLPKLRKDNDKRIIFLKHIFGKLGFTSKCSERSSTYFEKQNVADPRAPRAGGLGALAVPTRRNVRDDAGVTCVSDINSRLYRE